MDTTEAQLVRAIAAAPDDFQCQLIYADWLEEHGDPRGEVIRLGCQVQMTPCSDPQYAEIKARFDLLNEERHELFSQDLHRLGFETFYMSNRTGLVEAVECTVEQFLEHGDAACELSPRLQDLMLEDVAGGELADLAQCETLHRIRELALSCEDIEDEDIEALCRSPYLKQLTYLEISGAEINTRAAAALVDSGFRNLEVLELNGSEVSGAAIQILGNAAWSLDTLSVGGSQIGEMGLAALADPAAKVFRGLRRLDITAENLEGCCHRLVTHEWPELQHLVLVASLPDEDAIAVAGGKWPHLLSLNYASDNLGVDGFAALGCSRGYPLLEELSITTGDSDCAAGLTAWQRDGQLFNLKTLRLHDEVIPSRYVPALAATPMLAKLEELDLSFNPLDAGALRSLADSPILKQLKQISLSHCDIDDDGANALASGDWPELVALDLMNNEIEGAKGAPLLELVGAREASLEIGGNPLQAGFFAEFAVKLPWQMSPEWIFNTTPTIEELEKMLSSSAAEEASSIEFSSCEVTAHHMRAIASAASLEQLQELNLNNNDLGDETLAPLLASRGLPLLATLYISDNGLTVPDMQTLIDSPFRNRLRVLHLDGSDFGDAGVKKLVEAKWPMLESLNLGECNITAEGLAALAASPHLPALLELWLGRNAIEDDGVDMLVNATTLGRLQLLMLGDNPISEQAARRLFNAPGLPALRKLNVGASNEYYDEDDPDSFQSELRRRFDEVY